MFEQYCEQDGVVFFRKANVINMMCGVLALANVKDLEIAEDMIRGMCHIFVYGLESPRR